MMRNAKLMAMAFLALAACARPAEDPNPPTGTSVKGLLNPDGPDLSIDADRLRASIRVINNATVTQAEVDEGCARARTGRTLIRFEVKTPNFGPGDIHFGAVSCRSTDPSPSCSGVNCFDDPNCCCNGRNTCTASGGNFGNSFEFACAHGHIHFKSFAEYRLLTPDGQVAASGHKQSFCLMDIESATSNDACSNPNGFTCGDQGIHAGCADVYNASLPCSFVDATGVPPGDYVLQVTIDPLDVVAESNESNNVATASVRIGTPPPPTPNPSRALYLVRDGAGSASDTAAYYASLSPNGFISGQYTYDQWKADFFGTAPTVTGFYRNKNELGFWREMTCSATMGRGVGGCSVRNWQDSTDPGSGRPNLGTVAMRVDRDGRTQFFVFGPDGKLSPTVALDSEGPKFVPQVCTVCHGGEYRGAGSDPDLGAIFREFEPSLLEKRPGITDAQAEQEWFALNQSIRQANRAVRGQSEGGPFGIDAAKANMEAYVAEIYPSTSPPVSRPVGDPAHLPPTWQTGATDDERNTKATLWEKVVNPYCMSCHRSNSLNLGNYAEWQNLATLTDGRALLRRYIEVDPNDPDRGRLSFMPQAKLQFDRLSNDAEALLAIDQWLGKVSNRPPLANAGGAQTVVAGSTVSLSAAASSDPDGDPLTYVWETASGPAVTFSPSNTARDVTFVAPPVTANTDVVVRLRVRDSRLAEGNTLVTVTVTPPADTGRLVKSSSDTPINIPDNDATGITSTLQVSESRNITDLKVTVNITHTWIGDLIVTLVGPDGSTKVLHNRAGRNTHDIHQTYQVLEAVGKNTAGAWQLKVADVDAADVGVLQSWSLDFGVGDPPANTPPIADPGPDQIVTSGMTVLLSASASRDPDGDPLDYLWESAGAIPVTFTGPTNARDASFMAPSVPQTSDVLVRLRVRDGRLGESVAFVTVTVIPAGGDHLAARANDVPVQIPDNAPSGVTSKLSVTDAKTISMMNATVFIDHDHPSDLVVTLMGPNGFAKLLHNHDVGDSGGVHKTFAVTEAIGRSTAGNWSLNVSDGTAGGTGTLQLWALDFLVQAAPDNHPPVADAGSAQSVAASAQVTLDGTRSRDPDGDPLSFRWTQTAGSSVTLQGATNAQPTFQAPASSGTLSFMLQVSDGRGGNSTATVNVTVGTTTPAGRVMMAEMMVNPIGIDDTREWVKIYNGTNIAVDLSGYSLAWGGNTTWGDATNGNGGVLALSGVLAPGKCLLVGGPVSDGNNASPNFSPSADYGIGLPVDFPGNGLQNPTTGGGAPDAVALFQSPAAQVGAQSVPIDIIVYHQATSTPPTSRFIGPGGGVAPVSLVASVDTSGRSFRRVSGSQWQLSGAAGATDGPTPNTCTPVAP
jgi:subtilisin-like proprotein convertase family protein